MAHTAQSGNNGNAFELLELLSRIVSDLDAMRSRIAQLQFELEVEKLRSQSLIKEKDDLEKECAQYKKTILTMLPPADPFTEEEIDDLMVNGVSFDRILADIEEFKSA